MTDTETQAGESGQDQTETDKVLSLDEAIDLGFKDYDGPSDEIMDLPSGFEDPDGMPPADNEEPLHEEKPAPEQSAAQESEDSDKQPDEGSAAEPEEKQEDEQPEKSEKTDEGSALQPSEFWSDDIKAKFDALDDAGKEAMLAATKGTDEALTQKTMEFAERTKQYELYDQIATQYAGRFAHYGVTPQQAFAHLCGLDHQLATADNATKQQLILRLADDYGVNFNEDQTETGQPADPQVQALQDRVNQLEGHLKQSAVAQRDAAIQEHLSEFDAFAAKEENGQKLYPYANEEDVIDRMTQVVSSTQTYVPMEEAYRIAVASLPKYAEKHIQAEVQKALSANKEKAEQAARAGQLNTGAKSRGGRKDYMSISDPMRRLEAIVDDSFEATA